MKTLVHRFLLLATWFSVAVPAGLLHAQAISSFTHSGVLTENGSPANGLFDLEFTLHASETDPDPVGDPSMLLLTGVPVTNGLFTVALDFGPDVFNGEMLWLEIRLGPSGGGGALTLLTPRQAVRTVPQTTFARRAGAAVTAQSAVTAGRATVADSADVATTSVTAQRAMVADAADVATAAVTAQRAGALDPGTYTEPVTFDNPANSFSGASADFTGNIEAGGDLVGARLKVGGGHDLNGAGATIAGGQDNSAENAYSSVGGGFGNDALGTYATIPGGLSNRALGSYAFAAGRRAKANHNGSFVWGDSTNADFTSTATNQFLVRAAGGMGVGNSSPLHTVHLGDSAGLATINFASKRCVIEDSTAPYRAAFLAVAGAPIPPTPQQPTRIELQFEANAESGRRGIIGTATLDPLEIRTGNQTRLTLSEFGSLDVAAGSSINFGTTTRQMLNLWGGIYGIGVQADTLYCRSDNHFSWHRDGFHSDSANDPGTGGVELMRLNGDGNLDVDGNVTANSVILNSDRSAKENVRPVDPVAVLDKVVALPMGEWNYRRDPAVRHLGPMAQDFRAAFGLGPDDRHIATVDADGVALAAIQGLDRKLEASEAGLRRELAEKDRQIAELKDIVAALRRLVETSTQAKP